MKTKSQAYAAGKKVLELLGNKNWQVIVTQRSDGFGYNYRLSFHKGLLTLYPTSNEDDSYFACLFTFDESLAGTGDTRFAQTHGNDPKALVECMLQKIQSAVDKEVYELNVITELMANPKRRQPW